MGEVKCRECKHSFFEMNKLKCEKKNIKSIELDNTCQCDSFIDDNAKYIDAEKTKIFCLTFDEIDKLYNEMLRIKTARNFMMPVMMIRIESDKCWEEKEYVSTTLLNWQVDILCNDGLTREEKRQASEDKWIDINDEMKWDFI